MDPLDLSDESSVDSINVESIISLDIAEGLCYVCRDADGSDEVIDRSDLMDGGRHERLVHEFEQRFPPPWDPMCPQCGGDPDQWCEECQCQEEGCDRDCRFFQGVNYGCEKHAVI